MKLDTDLTRNVHHIRSWIGIIFVASVGFFFVYTVHASIQEFARSLQHSAVTSDVSGVLTLTTRAPIRYGDLVSLRAETVGNVAQDGHAYVTLTCFQDETVVYQLAAQPGVEFLLTDLYEPGFEWDGGPAVCNAGLMYRVPKTGVGELYLLESVSFPVEGRG